MRSRQTATLLAGVLAAGALVAVPAAAADRTPREPAVRSVAAVPSGSIVYVKSNNVWLTRADGSGQYQVTKDGTSAEPYQNPTMSDNARIAVMRRGQIHVLKQNGAVLSRFTPADLYLSGAIAPAASPVISPDGSRIAYHQLRMVIVDGRYKIEQLTAVIPWNSPKFIGSLVSGRQASWVSGSRLALTRSGDIHLYDVGSADSARWFLTDDVYDWVDWTNWFGLYDPEVSPDGSLVTYLAESAALLTAKVNGNPRTGAPSPPREGCTLTSDQTAPSDNVIFHSPSFGPDSNSIAYEELGALWVVTNIKACNASTTTKKIVAGALSPDWSRAPLDPGPRSTKPGDKPGSKSFSLKKKPVLKGKAKVGKKLRASAGTWSPAPKTYTYKWLRNGKKIKGATGAKYTVTKADRRGKVAVKVTVKRPGYKKLSATSQAKQIR
jgi:hypothetical protein